MRTLLYLAMALAATICLTVGFLTAIQMPSEPADYFTAATMTCIGFFAVLICLGVTRQQILSVISTAYRTLFRSYRAPATITTRPQPRI